jgi:Fe-S cluster biosynthesis and repair protein YggX
MSEENKNQIEMLEDILNDLQEMKEILQGVCDRTWTNENLYQTVVIAANALYARNEEIRRLKAELAAALLQWM